MDLQAQTPTPSSYPRMYKSLYMAWFSRVNDTIAICLLLYFFVEEEYSQQKRLEMAKERSGEEKEAHWDVRSGARGLWFTGSGVWFGGKNILFPVKFCALDSTFGALYAAAYTSEVQQGSGGFLQLLVQLWLELRSGSFTDGPLDSGRMARHLVDAPLVPEVGVLVAVEALAAGAAGLPPVAASFVQGGERGGGGRGGAAPQGDAAVVVVLLRIAAHQDRVGLGEIQWAVRVAWGGQEMERAISLHPNTKGSSQWDGWIKKSQRNFTIH